MWLILSVIDTGISTNFVWHLPHKYSLCIKKYTYKSLTRKIVFLITWVIGAVNVYTIQYRVCWITYCTCMYNCSDKIYLYLTHQYRGHAWFWTLQAAHYFTNLFRTPKTWDVTRIFSQYFSCVLLGITKLTARASWQCVIQLWQWWWPEGKYWGAVNAAVLTW